MKEEPSWKEFAMGVSVFLLQVGFILILLSFFKK